MEIAEGAGSMGEILDEIDPAFANQSAVDCAGPFQHLQNLYVLGCRSSSRRSGDGSHVMRASLQNLMQALHAGLIRHVLRLLCVDLLKQWVGGSQRDGACVVPLSRQP